MHSDHGCEHSDEHAVTVLHWLRGKDGLSVKAAGDIVKRCRQTVKDWTTTSSNGGLCKPGVVEELHVVAATREQDYRWLSYAQAVPHAEVSAWKPPGIEANTDPYNDDTWYSDWDSILDFHAVRSEDVDIPHTSPSKPPARVKAPLLRTYGRRGGSRIRASPAPSEMELFSQTMSSSPRRDIPSALAAFRSLLTAPPKQADELVERINSTSASSDDESENDHLSTHPRRPAAKRMRKSARKAGGSVKSPIPERTKSTRTTSRPKLVFQELQPTPEMLQHLITGQSRDAQGHVPLFKLRGLAFPEGAGGDEAQAQAAVISKIASAIASSTTVTATTSMMTRGGRLRSRLPTAHILNANLDPPSGTQIVNLFSKKPGIPDPRPHARTLTSDDTDHILSNITDAIEDFTADNIPNVLQRPNTNEDVIAATSSRSRAGDLVDDSFGNMDVDHMSAANEPSFSNNDIDGVADDDRQAMCQPSLDESEMLPPDLTASRSVFENDSVSMPEIPTTETSDARKPHAPLSFPAASSKQAVSPRRRQAMRIAPNSNTGPRTHGTALESNMKSVTSSIIPDIVFTSPMHDAVTVYTAGQVATSSTSPSRASRVKVSKVSRNSKDLPDIDLADFIELAWRKVIRPTLPVIIPFPLSLDKTSQAPIVRCLVPAGLLNKGGIFENGYLGAGRRGYWSLPLTTSSGGLHATGSGGVVLGLSDGTTAASDQEAQGMIVWTLHRLRLLIKQVGRIAQAGHFGLVHAYPAPSAVRQDLPQDDTVEIRIACSSCVALQLRLIIGQWACQTDASGNETDVLAPDTQNEQDRWLSCTGGNVSLTWWDDVDRIPVLLA